MGNSPKLQDNFGFKPIKVMDMHKEVSKIGEMPVNYTDFLQIVRGMEKAKYTIISYEQIDQLKEIIKVMRHPRSEIHSQGF